MTAVFQVHVDDRAYRPISCGETSADFRAALWREEDAGLRELRIAERRDADAGIMNRAARDRACPLPGARDGGAAERDAVVAAALRGGFEEGCTAAAATCADRTLRETPRRRPTKVRGEPQPEPVA